MNSLLKSVSALVMCVILAQWVLMPICPCQSHSGSSSIIEATVVGGMIPGSKAANLKSSDGLPNESCCCLEDQRQVAHASSPNVSAPELPLSLATVLELPPFLKTAGESDLLLASGTTDRTASAEPLGLVGGRRLCR